jgi:hypothetical protein
MAFLLALPHFHSRPEWGMKAEHTEAMDWFVIANLGFLFFMLSFFAVCGWMIWRRTTKPEPHIQLLMELEAESGPLSQTSHPGRGPDESAPWERQADWWKK